MLQSHILAVVYLFVLLRTNEKTRNQDAPIHLPLSHTADTARQYMPHDHGSTEKEPVHKRAKKLILLEWPSVRTWVFALIVMQLVTMSKIVTAEHNGVSFSLFGNMKLPVIVAILAINRSGIEEFRKHPNSWMVFATLCYCLSLMIAWSLGVKIGGEVAGIFWWFPMAGMATAFLKGGESHH